jgi:hypothetical protein
MKARAVMSGPIVLISDNPIKPGKVEGLNGCSSARKQEWPERSVEAQRIEPVDGWDPPAGSRLR